MMPCLTRIAFLATLALPLSAQLAPRWSEFAQVKAWEGTLRMRGSVKGDVTREAFFYKEHFEVSWTAEIRMRLTQHPMAPGLGMFVGSMDGNVSVVDHHKITMTVGNCVLQSAFRGSGAPLPVDGHQYAFELQIEPGGNYTLTPRAQYVRTDYTQSEVCPPSPDNASAQTFDYSWWPDEAPYRMPLPESGLVLRGSGTYSHVIESNLQTGPIADLPVHIEWELRPAGVEDDHEVVVTIPEYDSWRPEAGPDGTRGNSITLNARLRKKDGSEPSQKALKFEWNFVNVSREPGFVLNAGEEKEPDLRFQPGAQLMLRDDEGTKAETPPGLHTASSAPVVSWDWGGFAEVKVTAVMPDGRRITGYLEGDSGQKDIRLPKRAPGDHIAEIWRKQHKMDGVSDWADDENTPAGDGNRGDGLTLYEEYRGFVENRKHIEGNPDRKDYFILNYAGGVYDPGITLFALESQLEVHRDFLEPEFPISRVMNRNHADGPHRVDQHGVMILTGPPDQGFAIANTPSGRPGTPRHVTSIVVPRIVPSIMPAGFVLMLQASMAHELFHACNVWHHGEDDRPVNWRYKPGTDDFIETDLWSKTERDVRIVRENGSRFAPVIPATGINLVLGVAGGQHSGHDKCVMRYDNANAYAADSDPALRYKVNETFGFELCTTSAGTGVNDFTREPQSRYKEASNGRGDCAHQILVNDGVNAPAR